MCTDKTGHRTRSTTIKYRGYLPRQVVFRLALELDVVPLNSQREMWFSPEIRRFCGFQWICGFPGQNQLNLQFSVTKSV